MGKALTIRQLIEEQRARLRSSNPAERLAAALLIPGVLAELLHEISDCHLGRVLEREVCSNMSILAPELTVCTEAVERLRRPSRTRRLVIRSHSRKVSQHEGEHLLHAEAALYRAGIPHLLLPFQRNKFESNVFLVPCAAEARDCLCHAGFRETPQSPSWLIDGATGRPIRLCQDRT